MQKQKCKHFNTCSAPLCPLDSDLKKRTWFPDEPICKARGYQNSGWIKKQKRVAKVGSFETGYFFVDFLNKIRYIRKGLKGIDPDLSAHQLKVVLKKWGLNAV